MSLRWGILSTANITRKLLGSGHDQEFVAVGSRDLGRAQAFAGENAIPRAHGSYEELLADPEIDAIYNPLPNSLHVEWSIKALQAGKHVLCEKPFALDPKEAERMVQAAERVGRFLACASGRNRCNLAQRRAHEMMERGELGDVYHVRSSRWRFRGRPGHHIFPESHWFMDMQRAGGGAMMDTAVYQIDSVLWLLGSPKVTSVMAAMRQITEEPPPAGLKQDVEDHIVVMVSCEGGKSAIVEAAWVANMKGADGVFVFGTKAGLRFDPLTKITARRSSDELKMPWMGEETFTAVEEQVLLTPDNYTQDFGSITQQFVDGVAAGKQPHTPGRDALEVTRVIAAAYESVRSGKMVALV